MYVCRKQSDNMKEEKTCLHLDEIAAALSKADAGRMNPELSPKDREIME